MSNFNAIDNKDNNTSAVLDFLDSLNTDLNMPASEEVVQAETIDTIGLENNDTEEEKQEVTALVVAQLNSLFVAQKMFKKSIKISIKSFLISLSLGFLNLFL